MTLAEVCYLLSWISKIFVILIFIKFLYVLFYIIAYFFKLCNLIQLLENFHWLFLL